MGPGGDTITSYNNDSGSSSSTMDIAVAAGSDEISLHKNSIANTSSGAGIILKIPMQSIQNTNYKYTFTVFIYNIAAVSKTLGINGWGGSSYNVDLFPSPLTPPSINSNGVAKVALTITNDLPSSTTVLVSYSGPGIKVTLNGNFVNLHFFFQGINLAGELRMTFSYLMLDIGTTSVYTLYGTNQCSASNNDCVEGYSCVGNSCKSISRT